MKQTVIILLSASLFIFLVGCQESESEATQIRKARVIGNENIQLKKQLEEKDLQIEELKKQMEEIEAESAEKVHQAGETSIRSMRLLLEAERSNEALRLEVEKLQEQIVKLKAP